MKMCTKFRSLLVLLWILKVNGQILNYPGVNGGCMGCQSNVQTSGNYYGNYPGYPQYRQAYQYPSYGQYYQQYLPYVYATNQAQLASSQQLYPNIPSNQLNVGSYSPLNGVSSTKTSDSKITYNNVKTEIIDIDPKYFRYLYSSYLPQQIRAPNSRTVNVSKQSPYVVKIDSHQYNSTNIPQVIKKHDVQHKTFTFKKTFVLTPGNNDSVINLNFVNGVPVTTETSDDLREETSQPSDSERTKVEESIITTEEPTTTTENDTPKGSGKGGRRFIEIPENCPENTIFSEGKCWKKFSLSI